MKRLGLPVIFLVLVSGCAEALTDIFQYGSVEVQAVRRSGEPVAGAELTLYNDIQVMARGVTDVEGFYRFRFVPPRAYGVHADPPEGYARPEDVIGGPSSAYVDGLQMEEGTEESVSFTYAKIGPGRMEVNVKEADGSPVEGATVYLYGSGGDMGNAVTGTTGVVVFDPVSFGNRGIRVAAPPEYRDWGEGEVSEDGFLIEEGWSQEVSFVFEKCLGTVRGRVEDSEGAPVPGVPIRLFSSSAEEGLADTDSEGEAAFRGVRCAEFGLGLGTALGWRWEEGRGKSFVDGIKVTRKSDQLFTFSVHRCSATLTLSVEDQAGSPIPDILVELYTSRGPWVQGRTGDGGKHSFSDVPCGQE